MNVVADWMSTYWWKCNEVTTVKMLLIRGWKIDEKMVARHIFWLLDKDGSIFPDTMLWLHSISRQNKFILLLSFSKHKQACHRIIVKLNLKKNCYDLLIMLILTSFDAVYHFLRTKNTWVKYLGSKHWTPECSVANWSPVVTWWLYFSTLEFDSLPLHLLFLEFYNYALSAA